MLNLKNKMLNILKRLTKSKNSYIFTESKISNMITVQEIYTKAGFDSNGMSNRARAIKSLNAVLKNSDIKVDVCDKGMIWTGKDGFKYNVKISLNNTISRYKTNDLSPYGLLKCMGSFLRRDEVKQKIYSETSEPCICGKCNGTGVLPEFAWYADGVCFDCMGVGTIGKLMVKNVQKTTELKGRAYLNKFRVSGNYKEIFPLDVENIKPILNIGHPTAETFLSQKEDIFYIHQPVCMASSWYAIPISEFDKFKTEYNKLFKENIL